jgi:hypothetical protein
MSEKQSDGIFRFISQLYPTNSSLNNIILIFPEIVFDNHYRSNISKISNLVRDLLKSGRIQHLIDIYSFADNLQWADERQREWEEQQEEKYKQKQKQIEKFKQKEAIKYWEQLEKMKQNQ